MIEIYQNRLNLIKFNRGFETKLGNKHTVMCEVTSYLFPLNTFHFRYPAHLQQGKWFLFNELKKRFSNVKICFGWMTAKARRGLGLQKDHFKDAAAMIGANVYLCSPFLNIVPRRSKEWDNNPTKTCEEKNGFRHWDIVKAKHRRLGCVVGTVRSLKNSCITLRTEFDDNFPVSYSKSKLLWRPSKIVYC